MNFEEAIKLIEDKNYTHVKVLDPDGKKVTDINANSADGVISELNQYRGLLSSYGRLKFVVATDAIFKQNWKDAFNWTVTFSLPSPTMPASTPHIGGTPAGYISQNEASLMAQLAALKMEMDFNKKFDELNKKLEGSGNDPFEKYLPMLGLFANIDEKKLQSMMALAQIQGIQKGTMSTQSQGMAGLQEKKSELKTTVEEKQLIEEINDEMGKLCEKVEIANVAEFIKTLNAKPELLQTLIGMARNFK